MLGPSFFLLEEESLLIRSSGGLVTQKQPLMWSSNRSKLTERTSSPVAKPFPILGNTEGGRMTSGLTVVCQRAVHHGPSFVQRVSTRWAVTKGAVCAHVRRARHLGRGQDTASDSNGA